MGDRELLELAAMAAGILWNAESGYRQTGEIGATGLPMLEHWSPLTDDGDALRLAVRLNIEVGSHEALGYSVARAIVAGAPGVVRVVEYHSGNPCAATRRAIVRAAAEIGKATAPSATDGGSE